MQCLYLLKVRFSLAICPSGIARSCYCCCSVAKLCPTLCDPQGLQHPDLPVPHHLLEFTQVHVHWIGDAIQPSHPPLPSPPFAKSCGASVFIFLRNLHTVLRHGNYNLYSQQQGRRRVPFSPAFIVCRFSGDGHTSDLCNLIVVFICISLLIHNEHLFVLLGHLYIFFGEMSI